MHQILIVVKAHFMSLLLDVSVQNAEWFKLGWFEPYSHWLQYFITDLKHNTEKKKQMEGLSWCYILGLVMAKKNCLECSKAEL